jgi:hypothetical protein
MRPRRSKVTWPRSMAAAAAAPPARLAGAAEVPLAPVLLQRGPAVLLASCHPGPATRDRGATPCRTCPSPHARGSTGAGSCSGGYGGEQVDDRQRGAAQDCGRVEGRIVGGQARRDDGHAFCGLAQCHGLWPRPSQIGSTGMMSRSWCSAAARPHSQSPSSTDAANSSRAFSGRCTRRDAADGDEDHAAFRSQLRPSPGLRAAPSAPAARFPRRTNTVPHYPQSRLSAISVLLRLPAVGCRPRHGGASRGGSGPPRPDPPPPAGALASACSRPVKCGITPSRPAPGRRRAAPAAARRRRPGPACAPAPAPSARPNRKAGCRARSTTTVMCPRAAQAASTPRSCPAVVTSISAGAVTTGTPPAIRREQLPSGTHATSR